jgi:bilin biosynthesis protein
MANSKRFDGLFAWMSEPNAIAVVNQSSCELDNPGVKYIAATRLGACSSQESLDALVAASCGERDDIFERITRRKAIEALGRRKDPATLAVIQQALFSADEPTVVNAVDSLITIGLPLTQQTKTILLGLVQAGPEAVKRVSIQCFSRLDIDDCLDQVQTLEFHPDYLVSGAALAYLVRQTGSLERLEILSSRLSDPVVGVRRAAVIDLGDAGHEDGLSALASTPVSMPLRAKSAFQILARNSQDYLNQYFMSILDDDPRLLVYPADLSPPQSPDSICDYLRHRDEGKQYFGAKTLLELRSDQQEQAILDIWNQYGSDYGVHYLIINSIGHLRFTALSDLVIEALNNKEPQYAKSRIAAVWACKSLGLKDTRPTIERLFLETQWDALKQTCFSVLENF